MTNNAPSNAPSKRAHATDDDHGDVLDRQEQRKRLDRNEAAIIGEKRAGDRCHSRGDHEGEELIAGDADAERFGDRLMRADRAPGATGAAAQQVDAEQQTVAAAAAKRTKYQRAAVASAQNRRVSADRS